MDSTQNIFLWTSCFTTILSQCRGSPIKKGVLKNFIIFPGKHLCLSLFLSAIKIAGLRLWQWGFSCEFFKNFRNTFFPEHLWMTASVFKQLLALYLAIIYSWQLSSSEKSLVEKKVHPCNSKILQISFTMIFFFISFDKCLFTLSVTIAPTPPPPPFIKGGDRK